jgi:hypothetical protein
MLKQYKLKVVFSATLLNNNDNDDDPNDKDDNEKKYFDHENQYGFIPLKFKPIKYALLRSSEL